MQHLRLTKTKKKNRDEKKRQSINKMQIIRPIKLHDEVIMVIARQLLINRIQINILSIKEMKKYSLLCHYQM